MATLGILPSGRMQEKLHTASSTLAQRCEGPGDNATSEDRSPGHPSPCHVPSSHRATRHGSYACAAFRLFRIMPMVMVQNAPFTYGSFSSGQPVQ